MLTRAVQPPLWEDRSNAPGGVGSLPDERSQRSIAIKSEYTEKPVVVVVGSLEGKGGEGLGCGSVFCY